MKQFEFKVDTSTMYIKALNILGYLLLGFTIGIIIYKLKLGESINWVPTVQSIIFGLLFAFFPGFTKFPSFKINDQGIILNGYNFRSLGIKTISWDNISSIKVNKNHLSIKKTVGSKEKVNLPLYTKDQVKDLKAYLKEISFQNDVDYLE